MSKIEHSIPWLTDDSGRLIGYLDDAFRARTLEGELIPPGPEPALPDLGSGGAFATITGAPADNAALAAEFAGKASTASLTEKTDKAVLYDIITTTTYTLLETDLGRNLVFTNAAGCLVSVTDELSAGWASGLLRQGSSAGQITVQASGLHTLTSILGSDPADLTSNGAYALFSVHRTSATSFIMSGELGGVPFSVTLALSDMTTAITTGTTKAYWHAPFAFTLTEVIATLRTAGTTASTWDLNKAGVSVLSTLLTFDANETSTLTATTAPVIATASFAKGDRVTIDVDTAGTGAIGGQVTLIGTRTS